jgi:hypothetical protein
LPDPVKTVWRRERIDQFACPVGGTVDGDDDLIPIGWQRLAAQGLQ